MFTITATSPERAQTERRGDAGPVGACLAVRTHRPLCLGVRSQPSGVRVFPPLTPISWFTPLFLLESPPALPGVALRSTTRTRRPDPDRRGLHLGSWPL